MLAGVIKRELASCNGGPGLTADQLAARVGSPPAIVRNALSVLVFAEKTVTCDTDGRYKLGDPSRLITTG